VIFLLTHASITQVGRCISFNGNQQYISLPTLDFSSLSQGFSFSFWLKNEASGNNWARVFDFGNGAGVDNIAFSKYGSSTDIFLQIWASNVRSSAVIPKGFVSNTWFHYVWVVQRIGSSSTWSIYQNGKLILEVSNQLYPTSAIRFNYIGRSNWGDPFFLGKLDSFAIFKQPLQPVQAVTLFQSTQSNPFEKTKATVRGYSFIMDYYNQCLRFSQCLRHVCNCTQLVQIFQIIARGRSHKEEPDSHQPLLCIPQTFPHEHGSSGCQSCCSCILFCSQQHQV
jgi:hypothetical protein